MSTYFELLDRESGTMLKDYATEADALEDLRAFGREHGQAQLRGLALLRVSDDRPSLLAMDDDLIALVAQSETIIRQATSSTTPTVLWYDTLPIQGQSILVRPSNRYLTSTFHWTLSCV